MSSQKSNDGFHVRLDGVKLSEGANARIQAGIQKVIMDELAGYYPNPDDDEKPHHHFGGGVVVVPPKWWWGFIVRNLHPAEVEGIKGLNEAINAKAYDRQ